MTPEQLASEHRAQLIRTEKRVALVILAEFETLRKNIADYLTTNLTGTITINKLHENNFLAQILDEIETQIELIKNPFARIVTRGQQRVINFAADTLQKFLGLKASIFDVDREAIQKLIGRTQSGTSLARIFQRLNPVVREKAKETLIEGFALGESHAAIARRIRDVTGIARARALTISRTETNEAYRAASREFYREADIREYIWLSVLDTRTCLICWHLHGRKFKSPDKVFSHPNCRCTLIPKTKIGSEIPTGAEKFLQLEKGFQKEILGANRFEMFQSGAKFGNFVRVERSEEFGERYFVNSLSDFL